MYHNFNVKLATDYSIEESIMLCNFYYWITKNKANDRHFYNGRYWTYNSQKAMTELFPYWSRGQIQRILTKLEDNGLILKDNYNKSGYDRTTWYALTDKALSYFEQANVHYQTFHCSISNNGMYENEQPIPNNNTDNNTNNKDNNVEIRKEIIDYLNKKTGKQYKYNTQNTIRLINGRLREGFTLEDFKTVIDKKVAEWGNDPKMRRYLRPQTLFSGKFESYLLQESTYSSQYNNQHNVKQNRGPLGVKGQSSLGKRNERWT